ncbi:MAG: hypothetical protein AB7Q00_13230 [Phycisphaerales bacterium]
MNDEMMSPRARLAKSRCTIDAGVMGAGCGGAIRRGGEVVAWVSGANVLAETFDPRTFGHDSIPRESSGDATPMVIRSGWVEDGSTPAWLPASRGLFRERCDALEARGGEWWIWPRWDHVLSDVPSVQTFFRERSTGTARWGLILDVMGLLSAEMRGTAAVDHVERIVSALATHPSLRGVIMPGDSDTGGEPDPLVDEVRERLFRDVTGEVAWIEATGA